MAEHEFDFDLLKELTETSGVPGYEERVRDVVRREFESRVDEIRTDAMGNVVGTIEGSGDYAVAVAAHMDEIGENPLIQKRKMARGCAYIPNRYTFCRYTSSMSS